MLKRGLSLTLFSLFLLHRLHASIRARLSPGLRKYRRPPVCGFSSTTRGIDSSSCSSSGSIGWRLNIEQDNTVGEPVKVQTGFETRGQHIKLNLPRYEFLSASGAPKPYCEMDDVEHRSNPNRFGIQALTGIPSKEDTNREPAARH